MPDRTVSEMELRENARLAADEVISKIREVVSNPAMSPERLDAYATVLGALDSCATVPG